MKPPRGLPSQCCGGEIAAALSDPVTKGAIDQLNACDMRDQVSLMNRGIPHKASDPPTLARYGRWARTA